MPTETELEATDRVQIKDVLCDQPTEPGQKILDNLTTEPKSIPSKFFYDTTGSRLFEAITELPEYYIPRRETQLLRETAPRLRSELVGADVVEIGSGGPGKITVLLKAAFEDQPRASRYIPLDISKAALRDSAQQLRETFDELDFHGLVADFLSQLNHVPADRRRFFCFLGSTLGNLPRPRQKELLAELSAEMNPGDGLLLGVDRTKDPAVLKQAYDDSQGITAQFNLNILNVANRHAKTDFDPDDFKHHVVYNNNRKRIEMHLAPRREVRVSTPRLEREIVVSETETIHTENSHKFTETHVEELAEAGRLNLKQVFSDADEWFSLLYFKK